MKKIMSFLLLLILLLPMQAFGDVLTNDWKSATDDELSAAIEEISAELSTRKAAQQTAKEDSNSDCKVTVLGVGSSTKSLSYKVVDCGFTYWKKKSGSTSRFAFIAIKNTDKTPIYMKNCSMDFEDKSGKLLESKDSVSKCPDVIDPGEIGYFYLSSVNGGAFNDSTDLSNGCNLTAQFSLSIANETVVPFEITELELTSYDYFKTKCPKITGRVKNTGEKDISMNYINYIFKDHNGKVIWISGTNVMNLYAGVKVGLEIKELYGSPELTMDNIGSFEIIAEPYYYQYN